MGYGLPAHPAPGALSANTLRLPDGPGSVRGLSDEVGVDGFSGQVRYDVPLELPPGRAGVRPSLSLTYAGDVGNGPLGVGWTFSAPAIRRSTRLGVPAFTASDELELVGVGGGGRLVALPDGTWRLQGAPQAVKVERLEEGFLVTTSGGLRHHLGTSALSRQGEGGRTTAWFLARAVHPTGEEVQYTYQQDAGQVYLTQVRWGPDASHQVQLAYEIRPDQTISFRSGLHVTTAWRLAKVRVQSFAETVREYQLTYDNALPLSRLGSVRMTGRGGEGSLPPLTFSYAAPQDATLTAARGARWAGRLDQSGVSLVDVDGDGLTDLLRLDSAGRTRVAQGMGRCTSALRIPLAGPCLRLRSTPPRLMDVDGDARAGAGARVRRCPGSRTALTPARVESTSESGTATDAAPALFDAEPLLRRSQRRWTGGRRPQRHGRPCR